MARARNIKPGFFKNEDLAELAFEYRLLFIGLWTLADREGLLEDRPKRIKMEVFPADDVSVEKGLEALDKAGMIRRYMTDGCACIEVCNFLKHQHPHHKEPPSTIPKHGASLGFGGHASNQNPGQTTPSTPTKPETDPRQAPVQPQSNPSDFLIPDSGFSDSGEKTLSGKPDDASLPGIEPPARPPGKPPALRAQALEVLAFVNLKTGRDYQPVDANLSLIEARIKEGATVEDCRMVVARKWRDWKDNPEMRPYVRPATLFNATKFAQYRGECVVEGGAA